MKHIFSKTKALLMVVCISLGLLSTSCITEDLDACRTYTLKLVVVNANGEEITESGYEGAAGTATIFVFDENYKYLTTVEMSEQEIVSHKEIVLDYPKSGKLHFVAWGNADSDKYVITKGQTMDDFLLQLNSQGDGLAVEQDLELFYGNKEVLTQNSELTKNEEIIIGPKTAKVFMRTEGLANYHDRLVREGLRSDSDEPFDCEFYLDKTLSQYNSQGTLQGDSVYYNPTGEWSDAQYSDWRSPDYYSIFAGEEMIAALNIDGVYFDSRNRDENNDPITVAETDEVVVVFVWGESGEYLGARVKVRPWGYIEDPMEW